jgi:hypothetical protein
MGEIIFAREDWFCGIKKNRGIKISRKTNLDLNVIYALL